MKSMFTRRAVCMQILCLMSLLSMCMANSLVFAAGQDVQVVDDFELEAWSKLSWTTYSPDYKAVEILYEIVNESRDQSVSKSSMRVTTNTVTDLGTYASGATRNATAVLNRTSIPEGAKNVTFWVKLEKGSLESLRITLSQVTNTRIQNTKRITYDDLKDKGWVKIVIPLEIGPEGFFKWDSSEEAKVIFPLQAVIFDFIEPRDLVIYLDDVIIEY